MVHIDWLTVNCSHINIDTWPQHRYTWPPVHTHNSRIMNLTTVISFHDCVILFLLMRPDDQSLKVNASYTTLIPHLLQPRRKFSTTVWYHYYSQVSIHKYYNIRDDIVGCWCLQSACQAVRHAITESNVPSSFEEELVAREHSRDPAWNNCHPKDKPWSPPTAHSCQLSQKGLRKVQEA